MDMKRILCYFLGLFLMLGTAGCDGEAKEEVTGSCLFFLNEAETQLVSEAYEVKTDFKEAMVQEYVEALSQEPKKRGCKKLLPDNISLLEYSFGEADQLILNFDANYSSLSGITEILIRAALVKTFCQVDGVDYVEFYVNGIPYMNGEVPVGMMKADDFIDENMYNQNANVTVYFANAEGNALLESQRQVSYNTTICMEQLVVEQLIAGPDEAERAEGLRAVIPEGTQILKVSTKDGICYLDLNEKFMTRMENVEDQVVIYAVVNSLVELPNINKVQFRIEGESRKTYQSVAFSDMFERNLDLMENDN